jgi:hypothetical protein
MRIMVVVATLLGFWPASAVDAAPAGKARAAVRFARATTLATDCTHFIAATDRGVYWVTKAGISGRSLPAGPTTELVRDATVYGDIVAFDGAIWFATQAGIERVDEDGANRAVVVKRSGHSIAVDDGAVYWIENAAHFEIWSAGRGGDSPHRLGETEHEVARMVESGDRLYLMTSAGGVSAIAKAGGVVEQIAYQTFDLPRDIAANANRVAWASGPQSTVEQIMAGRNTVLFEDQRASVEQVAVAHDGRVVFAAERGHRWSLQLLPAGAGKLAPLRRETDAPVGDAKRARSLRVDLDGAFITQIKVNRREVLWAEQGYDRRGCAIRALTLP